MTNQFRLLVIALSLLGAMPVAAQSQSSTDQSATEKAEQHKRAVESCRQNRGVDCSSAEGLKEWELLERGREEAVKEGSRHLRPAQQVAPKTAR